MLRAGIHSAAWIVLFSLASAMASVDGPNLLPALVAKMKCVEQLHGVMEFECCNGPAFPRSAQVGDLMVGDTVLLFRTITASRYEKTPEVGWFGDNQHGFSYTLDPFMPLSWTYFGDDEKDLILIAAQSMSRDRLIYPRRVSVGRVDYTVPLTRETRLGDIAFYDEVKIPQDRENVIGVMRKKEFRALTEQYSGKSSVFPELMAEIARHPALRQP